MVDIHQPLPSTNTAIRLVTFDNFQTDQTISLTTQTYHLSSAPASGGNSVKRNPFCAVSYACGPPEPRHEIRLNQKPFHIRENLYELLKQFSQDHEERRLWIDALCINQDDPIEKAQQVRCLERIYSIAKWVLVWLGPAADGSDFVMDVASMGVQASKYTPYLYTRGSPSESVSDLNVADFWALLKDQLDEKAIVQLFEGLRNILNRPYWRRTWVVQENLSTPNDRIIFCGSRLVNSSLFYALCDFMDHQSRKSHEDRLFESQSLQIRKLHDLLGNQNIDQHWKKLLASQSVTLSLHELLSAYSDTLCEDPRDKVYALLNIASDCQFGGGIQADYEKDCAQLAFDTALYLAQSKLNWVLRVSEYACDRFLDILIWLAHTILQIKHHDLSTAVSKSLWRTDASYPSEVLKTFDTANFTSMKNTFGIIRSAKPVWAGGVRFTGLHHLVDPNHWQRSAFMYFRIDFGRFEKQTHLNDLANAESSLVAEDIEQVSTRSDANSERKESYVHHPLRFLVVLESSEDQICFQLGCSLVVEPNDLKMFRSASNDFQEGEIFITKNKFKEVTRWQQVNQDSEMPVKQFYLAYNNGFGYLLSLEDRMIKRIKGYATHAFDLERPVQEL